MPAQENGAADDDPGRTVTVRKTLAQPLAPRLVANHRLSPNQLRSAARLKRHGLRMSRPRNLKPAAAAPAPPFCPTSIGDVASKALMNQATPYSSELLWHG